MHFFVDIVYCCSQVERLVERVEHSTLLADRRDACRALKALSRKYRIEVGAKGMDILCQVLLQDRADAEIASYVLETLKLIMNNEIYEEEGIMSISYIIMFRFNS